MRPALSPRDRRTLGVGVGLIAALVFLSRGVPSLRLRLADQSTRVAALRQRLVYVQAAQRRLAPMRDSLRARSARLAELNASLISAPTPNAAAAMLGALVERIAGEAQIRLGSLELRADSSSRSAVVRVTLRVSAEGDVCGLTALLAGVDRRREPMIVRALAASASDPLSGDAAPEVLRFDLTIDGLALLTAEPRR